MSQLLYKSSLNEIRTHMVCPLHARTHTIKTDDTEAYKYFQFYSFMYSLVSGIEKNHVN